ncbi:hypothetical protein E4P39_12255 [Blastococcus sp. CT_GayMR19]|uniref:hypothetical protein n=1 Tax=Blastococcus sp. CT_GayMR19 TaxID=2559608 RepID=UPI00107404B2|nr:hypothetical protein [Blastococcus sp. CT_GayMR19]TFV75017.1 hypothetical protein E4P39_12255 [Blastococcus sp. CT_GayMR19]
MTALLPAPWQRACAYRTDLLAVLFGWLGSWAAVWSWLTEQSLITLAVGLPVARAVAFAAFSYADIRRVVL